MKRAHSAFLLSLSLACLSALPASSIARADNQALLVACAANAHDARTQLGAQERGWQLELLAKQRALDLLRSDTHEDPALRLRGELRELDRQIDGLAGRRRELTQNLRDCRRDGGPAAEGICMADFNSGESRIQADESTWRAEREEDNRVLALYRDNAVRVVIAKLGSEIEALNHEIDGVPARRQAITDTLRTCRRDAARFSEFVNGTEAPNPTALRVKQLPAEPTQPMQKDADDAPAEGQAGGALAAPLRRS